jgi:hypothetical protein
MRVAATATSPVDIQVDAAQTAARNARVVVTTSGGTTGTWVTQGIKSAAKAAADTTGPSMGRVVGVRGPGGDLSLSWRPAKDISGVAGYIVVYLQGIRALAPQCVAGTRLEQLQVPTVVGDMLQVNVTAAVARGVPYVFRVCAMDNVGNINRGRIWRVMI